MVLKPLLKQVKFLPMQHECDAHTGTSSWTSSPILRPDSSLSYTPLKLSIVPSPPSFKLCIRYPLEAASSEGSTTTSSICSSLIIAAFHVLHSSPQSIPDSYQPQAIYSPITDQPVMLAIDDASAVSPVDISEYELTHI